MLFGKLIIISATVLSSTVAFTVPKQHHSSIATTTLLHSTVTDEATTTSSTSSSPGDRDILIRSARGEVTERTPVWLMRQAGRYMSAFRQYSDKYPFRERSETPSMAIELSLQCHRAYGMDGIIMFSDILTPLPTLGIEFDVVKGVGPVISTEIRTEEDVNKLHNVEDVNFDETLPFIREILGYARGGGD